jgi:16S rRNA (adenine1518-N6/adenine1519-N6)-dimethyltransferase
MQNIQWVSSPSVAKPLLVRYGFTMKKSLGQNFLIDANVLFNIVDVAQLTENSGVLEIGPGIGSLTQVLASKANKVVALEIDERLQPILAETLAPFPNATVLFQDVLTVDFVELFATHFADVDAVHVVANLPYYITTPIIMHLLESKVPVKNMVLMMQKEVAERLAAKPSTKEYNSLSIAVQFYTTVDIPLRVPNTVFIPQPNVDSAVARLTLRTEKPVIVEDEDFLFSVIRGSFVQRRKTLHNNIGAYLNSKILGAAALERAGIDPSRRGETLTIQEFATLSEAIRAVQLEEQS